MVAAGVSVILIGFVTSIYIYGSKGFTRMCWLSNANQQGNYAVKTISEHLSRASRPSAISESGIKVSNNDSHSLNLLSGKTVVSCAKAQDLLSVPLSEPSVLGENGEVTWVELLLQPETNTTSALVMRQTDVTYSASKYSSVNNPKTGTIKRLLDNVSKVEFVELFDGSFIMSIEINHTKQKNLRQKFEIKSKLNLPVVVK